MPLFADLDRLRADLDTLRPLAPEQEARVLQKFRLEWNYNSNAIEGNSLTLGETRSLLLHGLTAAGKPMRDHLDIKRHNEAVVALEEFVRSEYPLTEQFIREMHQLLLGEPYHTPAQTAGGQPTRKLIVPGRYKTSPNNVLTATGEMFYFASPEETPGRMTDLVDWYRAEEAAPTLHPVALAAEFHYRFVRIHPFDDGNGRMSRLLMNLILLRHGYPMTVIQAADRNRYLAALAAADAGEPEPFLRFITENVEAGLRLMIRAARGESIDEPSDLDKKLALLKKQILTRDEAIETLWNENSQATIFASFFEPWLKDITNLTRGFDDLFLKKSYYSSLLLRAPAEAIDKTSQDFDEITNFIKASLSNTKAFCEIITLIVQWENFRQLNHEFNLALALNITFSSHKFYFWHVIYDYELDNMQPTNKGQTLMSSAMHKTDYDHAQIHEINYQLANKVYDFIAAKLAEADTPPA